MELVYQNIFYVTQYGYHEIKINLHSDLELGV